MIFDEGTDIYWARSRILEYLQAVRNKLPNDVNPVLGPDATSLGWGFSYALVDETGKLDLSELRNLASNIMSLSGIAIAIGAMVDASIIMVENAHKKLEEWELRGRQEIWSDVIIEAAKEVGPSLFFSHLVITVAFLPVFALQAQAGRLFSPLAYTKTFAMLFCIFSGSNTYAYPDYVVNQGQDNTRGKNPSAFCSTKYMHLWHYLPSGLKRRS